MANGHSYRDNPMFRAWKQGRKGFVINGDVMMCRLKVTASNPDFDSELFDIFARARDKELEAEIRELTERILGPEFEVRSISYRRGSVEIIAIVGVAFYAVSRYKNFVESLELLYSQLKGSIQRFANGRVPGPTTVDGSWSPGPALVLAESRLGGVNAFDVTSILLWYLIVSHAALMTLFIWQIARSLK
jgi:hypothetical protein